MDPNIFIVVLLLAVIVLTWWLVPRLQLRSLKAEGSISRKDLAEQEDEFRKTITSALGSVFIALTILIAYYQYKLSQETSKQSSDDENNKIRSSTFMKGLDLVGSSQANGRIIGIKILDAWADDASAKDGYTKEQRYNIIGPALLGIVRQGAPSSLDPKKCENLTRSGGKRVPEDIRAALEVIGRWTRLHSHGEIRLDSLDLAFADISNFDLTGANLDFSDLSGSIIRESNLKGARAYCTNFYGAKIINSDLSDADMAGAYFVGAQFRDVKFANSNLRSTAFSEAGIINSSFFKADLFNANFFRAYVEKTSLDEAKIV
jgi:Pentapeptide repeats (8 copies)